MRPNLALLLGVLSLGPLLSVVGGGEPAALNPFARPADDDRPDAVSGRLTTSDGRTYAGRVYMTRDKRLKIYDAATKRQREIPLAAVKQIEAHVVKEWMEKEWRFKETTSNEKYYTGRQYPARECQYTITLSDGRAITGPLAEIIYLEPAAGSAGNHDGPLRFLLVKRQKGEIGSTLEKLLYVTRIELGGAGEPPR